MDIFEKETLLKKIIRKMQDSVLVVEGKNDEKALREIGIESKIVKANGKTEKIIEKIKEGKSAKISLLFDFDEEGKRKTDFFREALHHEDVNADTELRKNVGMLFRIMTIEDLPRVYEELTEEIENQKRKRKT